MVSGCARHTLLLTHQTFLRTSSRHFLSLNFTKIQSTADSSTIVLNCAKHSLSTSEGISQHLILCRTMSQIFIKVCKFLLLFFWLSLISSLIAVIPSSRASLASSLGPSDSASQQLRADSQSKMDSHLKAIAEDLMSHIEVLLIRPDIIPMAVLWEFNDCFNDPLGHIIITESNKSQPKMALALCHYTSKPISVKTFRFIWSSATIIMWKLVAFVDSDSHTTVHGSKPWTKKFIKENFPAKFHQALLDLEAEHILLYLCSYHWKAEAMIGQAFLWQNDQGGNDEDLEGMCHGPTSSNANLLKVDAMFSQPLPPKPSQIALTTHVQDAPPPNVAKCAYQMSPGPKSPLASHVQKCSRDNARLSAKQAMGPPVPSSHLH